MMRPIDIPTRETGEFVQAHVPPGGHILEVGCGDGELAVALSGKGFLITALDSDPERIAKAREFLGGRAVVASWPDFDMDPVDAIVFTRSLHHMDRLPEAIAHVRVLLKPDGVFLVEDFAVESVDERTLKWFRDLVRSKHFASLIGPDPHSFVTKILAAPDVTKAFEDHHIAHGVHPFALMHRLVSEHFPACSVQSVPYLYRYFVSAVAETNESTDVVSEFLQQEIHAAERNAIALVGRRMVSRAR